MKNRILLSLLFACIVIHSFAVVSITKNIIISEGESITLDPASDVGADKRLFGNEKKVVIATPYTLSDDFGISVTYEQTATSFSPYKLNGNGASTGYYRIYNLVANYAGEYTFKSNVKYLSSINYTPKETHNGSAYWGTSNTVTATYYITVVKVTSINIPNNLTLSMGDTYTFTPIISDSRAHTMLSWQSSNTAVATVNASGVLTTKGIGTATITCTAQNGVSAQCIVKVNPILVGSVILNESVIELDVGEKLQLETNVSPYNATNKSVTWSSTNEVTAVVSDNGLVTAVGSGTCEIKATANDGSGKTASCLVKVKKNNKVTVSDLTQCSGGRGTLKVLLADEEPIMGFQFDLQLPIGVTVPEDSSNNLMAVLTSNVSNTHSISSNKISDGLYRFIITPQGNRVISKTDGNIMTIFIDVADDVVTGNYDMIIKDVEMTVKKVGDIYEDIHPKNSIAILTITEAMRGDVNGDGRVSVTDVISMNSYILEQDPAQFIRKVADLNGDGKVTITDMVQVIDIILGR